MNSPSHFELLSGDIIEIADGPETLAIIVHAATDVTKATAQLSPIEAMRLGASLYARGVGGAAHAICAAWGDALIATNQRIAVPAHDLCPHCGGEYSLVPGPDGIATHVDCPGRNLTGAQP